jgi:uncharacterized protein
VAVAARRAKEGGMWDGIGDGAIWLVATGLVLVGLVGCILPVLPGHLLILLGAVALRLGLGGESGLRWWSFLILILLMAVSQTFEILSGAAGARWFGGGKWGAVGALIGAVAGLFFMPIGLLAGPLLGAMIGEKVFAGKEVKPAVMSGVGSMVGTLAGMGFKLLIGGMMVVWLLLDVFLIGK